MGCVMNAYKTNKQADRFLNGLEKEDYFIIYEENLDGLGKISIGKIIKKIGSIPKKIIKPVIKAGKTVGKIIVVAPVKATLTVGKGALKAALKYFPPAIMLRFLGRLKKNSALKGRCNAAYRSEERRLKRRLTTAEGQAITKRVLEQSSDIIKNEASTSGIGNLGDLGFDWGQLIIWICFPVFKLMYEAGQAVGIIGSKQKTATINTEGDFKVLEEETPVGTEFAEPPLTEEVIGESSFNQKMKSFSESFIGYVPWILGGIGVLIAGFVGLPKLLGKK